MPSRARLSLTMLPVPATHPVAACLARLSTANSRRTYLATLHRAARLLSGRTADAFTLPWTDLRYSHVLALRTALLSLRLSPSSINGTIVAVQAVCKECWRAGALGGDDLQRIADVPRVGGSRVPAGRMLTVRELHALQAAARRDGHRGARLLAAFALLYGLGLRLAEAASLPREALGPATIRVIGKGNKEAVLPLDRRVRALLDPWLRLRGPAPGPLLCALHKSGVLMRVEEGLSPSGLYQALTAFRVRAGLGAWSPHDLRRSFNSHLLARGVPLRDVQLLMRHANPATTARYDRRPLRELTRHAGRLPL